jgi:hypothetical protein
MKIVNRAGIYGRERGEQGSALVMMTLSVAALAALSAALLAVGTAGEREVRGSKELVHARYIAEAGIAASMLDIRAGGDGILGDEGVPVTWGGASYWVTRTDIDVVGETLDRMQLVATGFDDRAGARIEAVVKPTQLNLFQWAAFGDESLAMDSNAHVDSYNSTLGTYGDQAVNSVGTMQYASTNGDVGSNGDVTMEQNSYVWGDSSAGPGSGTEVLGNAHITGSTAPMTSTIELPPIDVPSYASLGNYTVASNQTLAPGNYHYNNFTINGTRTLTVTGPATLVFENYTIKSNANLVIDATNGPVTMYVINDFIVGSNSTMGSTDLDPADFHVKLLSDNVIDPDVLVDLDELDFNSNAKMYGTMYAPDAAIEIHSNFQLFGSLVAHSIDLDSNSFIHYDENLMNLPADGPIVYQVVSWRPMPFQLD